jgi:D-glycero-alpha-D-manno-heptose-7-phosphate kinase
MRSGVQHDRLVRARAPLRLGLAGGGTDVSPYCDTFGGAVLNVTLHRFAYAFIAPRVDRQIKFHSSDLGVSELLPLSARIPDKTNMILHYGVYSRMMRDFNNGDPIPMTITTHADSPAGSGLGTSSALVVALVDAFRVFLGLPLGQYDVARLAFEIERQDLGQAGGRQDQYAAAFGGVNFIEFLPDGRVIVNPLRVNQHHLDELEASMVTCFTGRSRLSSSIIHEQSSLMKANNSQTIEAMHQLKSDAIAMKSAFLVGDIDALAQIMRGSWEAKKRTASSISSEGIDALYQHALSNGALGGKMSGAGGGGFFMFVATPETRPRLIGELRAYGASAEAVQFTEKGCETWIRQV